MTTAEYKTLSDDAIEDICKESLFGDSAGVEVVCPERKGPDHDCGCEVEPDGRCHHGCPSILLVMGF